MDPAHERVLRSKCSSRSIAHPEPELALLFLLVQGIQQQRLHRMQRQWMMKAQVQVTKASGVWCAG